MIKTCDINQRDKFAMETEVQIADTVLLTEELMIINHMFDKDESERAVVCEIMGLLSKKINSLSLKNLKLLFIYNDEQLHKTKVKWKNAGVIKFAGTYYKLISPLELTTYRARVMLKHHLASAIETKSQQRVEKIKQGDIKFVCKGKIDENTNFKPDWMDW